MFLLLACTCIVNSGRWLSGEQYTAVQSGTAVPLSGTQWDTAVHQTRLKKIRWACPPTPTLHPPGLCMAGMALRRYGNTTDYEAAAARFFCRTQYNFSICFNPSFLFMIVCHNNKTQCIDGGMINRQKAKIQG